MNSWDGRAVSFVPGAQASHPKRSCIHVITCHVLPKDYQNPLGAVKSKMSPGDQENEKSFYRVEINAYLMFDRE